MSFHCLKPSGVFLTQNNPTSYKGNDQCGPDSTVGWGEHALAPSQPQVSRADTLAVPYTWNAPALTAHAGSVHLQVEGVLIGQPPLTTLRAEPGTALCTGAPLSLPHILPTIWCILVPHQALPYENRTLVSRLPVPRAALACYGTARYC